MLSVLTFLLLYSDIKFLSRYRRQTWEGIPNYTLLLWGMFYCIFLCVYNVGDKPWEGRWGWQDCVSGPGTAVQRQSPLPDEEEEEEGEGCGPWEE